jgi:hypothetical protein
MKEAKMKNRSSRTRLLTGLAVATAAFVSTPVTAPAAPGETAKRMRRLSSGPPPFPGAAGMAVAGQRRAPQARRPRLPRPPRFPGRDSPLGDIGGPDLEDIL